MTFLKTTAIAIVIAAVPASSFACEWMSSQSASTATPVAIGSATTPAATPVDTNALDITLLEVDKIAEDNVQDEDRAAE